MFHKKLTNVASIGGLDPLTVAWIANVQASTGVGAGTVSATQKINVNNFIVSLRNNVHLSWDGFWLIAAENTKQAQTDLINGQLWTYNGTPTLASRFTAGGSASAGIAGDASTVFLDTGLNLSTTTNFTQNSATLGCYMSVAPTTQNAYMGNNGSSSSVLLPRTTPNRMLGEVNGTAGTQGVLTGNLDGLQLGTRTDGTITGDNLYQYNSSHTSGATAAGSGTVSAAPANQNCILLGLTGGNSLGDGTMAAGFVGAKLTGGIAGQVGSLAAALKTYMATQSVTNY